jgi:DNA-binding LacI/PurR family transcriptional regulator
VNELGYVHRQRQSLAEAEGMSENGQRGIQHITFCFRPNISPLIAPELGNHYFPLVLRGAEAECRRLHLNLSYRLIEDDVNDLSRAREILNRSQSEALLLVNFIDHELVNGLLKMGLPAVLVDHYFPDLPLDAVLNDSYNGAFVAVKYFIEQGHRRIAFVDGLPHYTIQRRFDAYRRALESAGIVFDPALVLGGDLMPEGGVAAADEFVKRGLDATAVFCANDNTAFGFIQGLVKHGRRIPDEVSVVGFDDVEAARLITPPLTTIRANATALGRVAIRKLLERVNDATLPVTQTYVSSELVIRNSVRAL